MTKSVMIRPVVATVFAVRAVPAAMVLLTLFPGRTWAVSCDQAKPKQPCELIIQTTAPVNGRTVHARNSTAVTVVVQPKSPFEKCTMTLKDRQAIVQENGLQAFITAIAQSGIPLSFLSRAVSGAAGAHPGVPGRVESVAGVPPPQWLTDIRRILSTIADQEQDAKNRLEARRVALQGIADRITALHENPAGGATTEPTSMVYFRTQRDGIANDIDALISGPGTAQLPDVTAISENIKSVADLISAHMSDILAISSQLLGQLDRELSAARAALNAINDALSSLQAAQTKLIAQRNYLKGLPIEFTAHFVYSDINSVVKQEVSCADRETSEVTAMGPISFTIEFRDLPRSTFSVGVLTSLLDKREIGSVNVKDTSSPNGFKTVFGETDRAGLQIIPFSFMNLRLYSFQWGRRDVVLNLSEGFGINPNNGGKDPEFFSGLSLGFRDLHIHFGGHHGRWQELGGGFGLGESVPEKLSSIPVNRRYTTHWAFGISYRLPPK